MKLTFTGVPSANEYGAAAVTTTGQLSTPILTTPDATVHLADVPASARAKPEAPPCYAPCPGCGTRVLTGATAAGTVVALDTSVFTYVVDWTAGTPAPVLAQSRAYPVHGCG